MDAWRHGCGTEAGVPFEWQLVGILVMEGRLVGCRSIGHVATLCRAVELAGVLNEGGVGSKSGRGDCWGSLL